MTGGTQSLAGLDVTVHFKAFETDPVMRQIVELSNPTSGPITTTVQWINNSGNDSSQQTIATSSGDTISDVTDRWVATADSSNLVQIDTEAIAWILFGPNMPSVTLANIMMLENEVTFGSSGNQGLTAEFGITLGPGQTSYLMWFVILGENGNEAITFANQFNDTSLSNAFFQGLIADLPQGQFENTTNWMDVAVIPEPSTYALMGLGLLVLVASGYKRLVV